MRLQTIWKDPNVFIATVPLAIDDYGFIYINDIGVINITINIKHRFMLQHQIKYSQLKELVLKARCDIQQKEDLNRIQEQLLNQLNKYPEDTIFTF